MSKQDRQAARNVAGLEYKYNFGKSFADLRGMQEGTSKNMKNQAQQTATELANRIKYDEYNRIVAMLNAATDAVNFTNRLSVESENFSLSTDGTITANKGTICGFVIGDDSEFVSKVLRSSSCVSGTISWKEGTTNKSQQGYIFTVLTNYGLVYVVKESNLYTSNTLAKITAFQSPTFSNLKFDEDGDGVFT